MRFVRLMIIVTVVGAVWRASAPIRRARAIRCRRRHELPRRQILPPIWPTSVPWIGTSDRTILASVPVVAWLWSPGHGLTEYHMDLTVTPKPAKPNESVRLTFSVFDPWKDRRVEKFTVVHEKLFHAFIVSRDLQFFVHDHPTWDNGSFRYDIAFPKPGMYRVLGDFYPEAAAPQLLTETIFVAGAEAPAPPLARDYSQKQAENLAIEFSTSPSEPIAGVTTQMRWRGARGRPAEIPAPGVTCCGQRRPDRHDAHASLHRRRQPADAIQSRVSAPTHVSRWVQFQRNGSSTPPTSTSPPGRRPAAAN
jgi:hypothetical protein